MLVEFRRQYSLDFREALDTMWHGDIAVLIDGLERWSDQDENLAMLVDRLDYWLNSESRAWITDPDDPAGPPQTRRHQTTGRPGDLPRRTPSGARPQGIDARTAERTRKHHADCNEI